MTISEHSDDYFIHVTDGAVQVWSAGAVVLSHNIAPQDWSSDQGTWVVVDGSKDLAVFAVEIQVDDVIEFNGPDGSTGDKPTTGSPGRNVSLTSQTLRPRNLSAAIRCRGGSGGSPPPANTVVPPKITPPAHSSRGRGDSASNGAAGIPGAPGVNGATGGRGGTISICASTIVGSDSSWVLDVSGGPGTRGQDGQAAGDGQDGGDGNDYVLYPPVVNYEKPGAGGPPGKPGYGGTGGDGGAGGSINVTYLTSELTFTGTPKWAVVNGGAKGPNGSAGAAATGGRSGQDMSASGDPRTVTPAPYPPEYNGTAPSTDTAAGATGSMTFKFAKAADQLYPAPAHATWLQMVQTRASDLYFRAYLADPNQPNADDLKACDSLADFVVQAIGPSYPSDTARRTLWSGSRTIQRHRNAGYDSFGRKGSWVPLQFWKDLKNDAQSLSDLYFTVSQHTQKLLASQIAQGDREQYLTEQRTAAEQAITTMQSANLKLEKRLQTTAGDIKVKVASRASAQAVFDNAKKALDGRMALTLNFQLSDVVDAFAQVCFVPLKTERNAEAPEGSWSEMGIANAGLQGASLLDTMTTKVQLKDGTVLDKSALISTLSTYTGDADGLYARWNTMHGMIATADPDGTKLLADETQLTQFLDNLPDSLNSPAHDVKSALKKYVRACQALNKTILRYNHDLQQWLFNAAAIDDLHAALTTIQTQLSDTSNLDPCAPELAAASTALQGRLRQALMSLLDLLTRAFRFYRLTTLIEWTDILTSGDDLRQDNINTVLTTLKVDNDTDQAFSGSTPMNYFPYFDETRKLASAGPGAVWLLTDAQLADLRSTGSTDVTIPNDPNADLKSQLLGGFVNYRIAKAIPWITGIRTTSNDVTVTMQHTGECDSFLSPDPVDAGTVFSFNHDPVTVGANYPCDPVPPATIKDDAAYKQFLVSMKESGDLPYTDDMAFDPRSQVGYTGVGPFCKWTITISADENPGLDLTGITAGWIDLQGINMKEAP